MKTEEFLGKAEEVHGDRYGYAFIENPQNSEKVKIFCRTHGPFLQKCYAHLSGRGCFKCAADKRADAKRKTTPDYLSEVYKIHGDEYSYEKTKYAGAKHKIIVTCPRHGDFTQEAGSHLSGSGCPSCFSPLKGAKTPEEKNSAFIEISARKHDNTYDYSKTTYKNNRDKVIITCPEHGDFLKSPSKHLSGQGCPSCPTKQGIFSFKTWSYDATKQHMENNHSKPCKLYLLKMCMDGEFFYKIGITTRENIGERITEIRKRSKPSTVDLITYESSDYLSCNLAEEILLSKFCDTEYNTTRKFKGHTECFLHGNEDSLKNCFSTVVSDVLTKPYEDRMSQFLGRCGSS